MQEKFDLNKVLYVGPSLKAHGGISALLNLYKSEIKDFRFLPTTSHKGMFATYLVFAFALVKLPFYRLFTTVKIVHIHGASKGSWIRKSLAIRLASALGFKVVWHCHGGKMKEFAQDYGIEKFKRTLLKCDEIVVLSQTWLEYFHDTLGFGNVTIVNNIVSLPQPKASVNDGLVRFIFLGDILSRKGVFDMLETLRSNKSELVGKMKLIIGGKGEVDKLSQLIKDYHIEECVEYVGWVGGEKKVELLSQSDILILPSYVEGLPISILEGMSYKMPIISTRVGGIPEIVKTGENGILIQPGDLDALYRAIMFYIDNRAQISAQGEKAGQLVSEFYPDSVIASLIKLYEKILK